MPLSICNLFDHHQEDTPSLPSSFLTVVVTTDCYIDCDCCTECMM